MRRPTFLLLRAAYSVALAAVVIVLARYYEGLVLLAGQVLVIAGPSFAASAAFSLAPRPRPLAWAGAAALVTSGWAYVVYVDTRPYTGGGASFAVLFG